MSSPYLLECPFLCACFVCACMWRLKGLSVCFLFGHSESPSPWLILEAPAVLAKWPSVSFPHTLLFSLFLCHLLFRDESWQTSTLPSHFLQILLERALICANTNPALYFYFEPRVTGDIKERMKNTEREGCSIASSWINGRKSGTINPPFSLFAEEYDGDKV